MPTIMVDPGDMGTQAGVRLEPDPDFKRTPIRDKMGEPIDPAGDYCVRDGKPCILFGDWDYGEDWSGEYVREVHPFTLIGAPKISADAFWDLVRAVERARKEGSHGFVV